MRKGLKNYVLFLLLKVIINLSDIVIVVSLEGFIC